jgi:anti-sigma regulatory factor (Ser/Thr protein kinase)
MSERFETTIPNDVAALPELMDAVDAHLQLHAVSARVSTAVKVVVEESLTNIIRHGYDGREPHLIGVRLDVDPSEIAIRLEDDGKPFNPLTVPRQEASQPPSERIEAGLGMHLVRNMTRAMSYRWQDGKNVFEIWVKR